MKILKNRLVIGCLCIIIAFVIGFIGVPHITVKLGEEITVVIANQDITKGSIITADMFKITTLADGDILDLYNSNSVYYYNYVTKASVPSNEVTNIRHLFTTDSDVIYAATDMKANDIVTSEKISTSNVYKDENLRALGPNEYAVAVTVNTIAEGIAAKVMAGDIVMPLIYNDDLELATTDPCLMYVEVLNVLNSEATEINDPENGSPTGVPSVVTFKVNIDQAIALARYENSAEIHLVLVSRGDEVKAKELLQMQTDYLKSVSGAENAWFYVGGQPAAQPAEQPTEEVQQ